MMNMDVCFFRLVVPNWMRSVVLLQLCLLTIHPASVFAEIEARDTVKKGTIELGVIGGYWKENSLDGTKPSSNQRAVFVLPQIGMVLTDEFDAGWLSGNFEVLAEPLGARYSKPFTAYAFGGSLVVKYNFLSLGRWMPFWDMGAGMLWTDLAPRIPEQSQRFNFVLETGPGLHYFVTEQFALTTSVRYHHISNANTGTRNVGLNAWLFSGGFSFFIP
ncbi:MAG: lipid A 3-O-deacylase [Nitrospirales bacterium]|nr:MAG: lipid A 3-O-deacylase [Nitrospirales bacterium]